MIDAGNICNSRSITPVVFKGGSLYPGREVFLRSYNRGEQLPTLNPIQRSSEYEWPNSTSEAILQSADIYLEAIIKDLIQRQKTLQSLIVITGGGSDTLATFLDSRLQVVSFPELIHYSLYFTHCKLANP